MTTAPEPISKPTPRADEETALFPELAALASALREERGTFLFPQASLREATTRIAGLSLEAKEARALQLLALGIKIIRADPVRGEAAARQLAELVASIVGDPRLASDLFHVVKRSSAEAELTGREIVPVRAPVHDAARPAGTLKLSSIAPKTPQVPPGVRRAMAGAQAATSSAKTDPRVGAKPAIHAAPRPAPASTRAAVPSAARRGR